MVQLTANGPRVTLVTAVLSNFDNANYADPTTEAQSLASTAAAGGSAPGGLIAQWRSLHQSWWSDYWGR
jgi:hypothetical protein